MNGGARAVAPGAMASIAHHAGDDRRGGSAMPRATSVPEETGQHAAGSRVHVDSVCLGNRQARLAGTESTCHRRFP